ncbi:MAG TPA: BlaI/MecI/CopY family transcriptional regulator [Edaphobacter sp.]|jgi:predicted transcriptional regulator|nr:BlaI/MecI/CopY family transcriptional regulator [Edaphobacter sp.]
MTGRKKGSNSLTPLELQIMQVLWSEGQSNVLQVQKNLAPNKDLAYNTVQTMLNILHRKGRVQRTLKGRAYFYRPIASREKFRRQAVLEFVERLFGGSSEELVMSLIKGRQLDPERIADLSRKLAIQEEGERDD